jgi:hypothetical protein
MVFMLFFVTKRLCWKVDQIIRVASPSITTKKAADPINRTAALKKQKVSSYYKVVLPPVAA